MAWTGESGKCNVVRFRLYITEIPHSGARRDGILSRLVAAGLQEKVRGHQEQVDLDFGQTRLPQRCQEYPAAEWRKTVGMEPHQNVTLWVTIPRWGVCENLQCNQAEHKRGSWANRNCGTHSPLFCLAEMYATSYPNIFLPHSSFGPQVEYKYDKEMMKGCVIPVVDDKFTVLALKNNEMASTVSLSVFSPCACRKEISRGLFLTCSMFMPPCRWNTKKSTRRQRATTCPSRTLLRSCTPRPCALWPQRWMSTISLCFKCIFFFYVSNTDGLRRAAIVSLSGLFCARTASDPRQAGQEVTQGNTGESSLISK